MRYTQESGDLRPTLQICAFFDLDKTLISENSGTLFLKHRYVRGETTAWDLLGGLGSYFKYKLGLLDLDAWTEKSAREIAGVEIEALRREAAESFDAAVEARIYPEAERLIESHRAQGHLLAIVSASIGFVVEPLAKRLRIEHALYTQLEEKDGRLTGRVKKPLCYREGKIFWLRKFVEAQRIDLARSYFYTDSITDLPLLELVGHPVAVNPDPLLYRKAIERVWPVRFFQAPDFSSVPDSHSSAVKIRKSSDSPR